MPAIDPSKILYWINQGGPVAQSAILYGLYYGYKMVSDLLSEIRRTNLLLAAQNDLLSKSIEKAGK